MSFSCASFLQIPSLYLLLSTLESFVELLASSLSQTSNIYACKIPFGLACFIAILCNVDFKISVWICAGWSIGDEGALVMYFYLGAVKMMFHCISVLVLFFFWHVCHFCCIHICRKLLSSLNCSRIIRLTFLCIFVTIVFCVHSEFSFAIKKIIFDAMSGFTWVYICFQFCQVLDWSSSASFLGHFPNTFISL